MAGDGRSDCPLCHGRGVIDIPPNPLPSVQRCQCVEVRDLLLNLRRGWLGLEKAKSAKDSPLVGWVQKDLFITATKRTFQGHLRYTMLRQSSTFYFSVLSDADLMDLWLQPLDRKGQEIHDPDYVSPGNMAVLSNVVTAPQLLIVYLGVKAARNSAMPEVLLETIFQRQYKNRPLWLVEQPNRKLEPGHLAYSDDVIDAVDGWPSVELDSPSSPSQSSPIQEVPLDTNGTTRRRILSTGGSK